MTEVNYIKYDNENNKIKCKNCDKYDWLDNIQNNKQKIVNHCLRKHKIIVSKKIKKNKKRCIHCNKIHGKNNKGIKAIKCLELISNYNSSSQKSM